MVRNKKAKKKYHVFLSHNGSDKPLVEKLATKLKEAGLEPFLDKWDLVSGEPWQESLEIALDESATCAVFLGPKGLGRWQNEEMRSALDDRVNDKSFRVIPVLLPGTNPKDPTTLPRFLRPLSWVDFRSGLDNPEAFRRLVAAIRGERPGQSPKQALERDHGTEEILVPSLSGDNTEQNEGVDEIKWWKDIISYISKTEIPKQLRKISPSSKISSLRQVELLKSSSLFMGSIKSPNIFLDEINTALSIPEAHSFGYAPGIDVYGVLRDDYKEPIRIWFPPIMLGVTAIFYYLRHIDKCNLELEYHFPHALAIVGQIKDFVNGQNMLIIPPSVCVVGDAPGTALHNLPKEPFYKWSMLMPPSEQKIVRPQRKGGKDSRLTISRGQFFFPQRLDILSTPLLSLDRLIRAKKINKSKVQTFGYEPTECLEALRTGDADCHSILWTPHWQIYTILGICEPLNMETVRDEGELWFSNFLYLERDFLLEVRAQCLKIAIRNTWMILKTFPSELDKAISSMLNDKGYVTSLMRFCGVDDSELGFNTHPNTHSTGGRPSDASITPDITGRPR